jgi:hypothetical protein
MDRRLRQRPRQHFFEQWGFDRRGWQIIGPDARQSIS